MLTKYRLHRLPLSLSLSLSSMLTHCLRQHLLLSILAWTWSKIMPCEEKLQEFRLFTYLLDRLDVYLKCFDNTFLHYFIAFTHLLFTVLIITIFKLHRFTMWSPPPRLNGGVFTFLVYAIAVYAFNLQLNLYWVQLICILQTHICLHQRRLRFFF